MAPRHGWKGTRFIGALLLRNRYRFVANYCVDSINAYAETNEAITLDVPTRVITPGVPPFDSFGMG